MKNLYLAITGICCLLLATACVSQNDVVSWHFNTSREDISKIENKDVRAVIERNDSTVALLKHDAQVLLTTAEQLKELENEKKASDPFWNSRNIFATAAVFALGQDDEDTFRRIVKSEPDFIAMKSLFPGKTRGIVKKTFAIPEIVEVKSVAEAEKLPANKRAFWGMYARHLYPEVTESEFAVFCNKINLARSVLESAELAKTAIQLSKFKSNNAPECFTAQKIFSEAVDIAILLHDQIALEEILEMYKTAPFKTEKGLRSLQSEITASGKTRGWNEHKIRNLRFTEVSTYGGETYTARGDDRSQVSSTGDTRVRHFTGRDALAYKIKKFYEE